MCRKSCTGPDPDVVAFPWRPTHPPTHRKDEGNEWYKKRDYRAAIDAYTQAIALEPAEAAYYGNRAAAAMMLLQYEQAAVDCEHAIQLTPDNPKLYFRKGKALACMVRARHACHAVSDRSN